MLHRAQRLTALCAFLGLAVLAGCATNGDPRDPLEPLNRSIYTFNDGLDTMVLKPVAVIYGGVTPQFLRTGISNVFSNVNDVIVALNNLLQGKFNDGLSDVARVMVNSTVGLLGFFDVATHAGLEKHNEDFGQTLGVWGLGDGPYLVLPFFGPRNLRDTAGLLGDYKFDAVSYIDPVSDRNVMYGLRLVSRRESLLGASRVLSVAALDEYAFVREAYLQQRRNLVYDGNPPREKDDDEGPGPETPAPRQPDQPAAKPAGTSAAPAPTPQ